MRESTLPIVYPLSRIPDALRAPLDGHGLVIRVTVRALEGMQKEAVVARSDTGRAWRMLCDEGPYLNGTDLAPPPLAYFSAGVAAHNAARILAEAAEAGIHPGRFTMIQDTFYSMEGSALAGTMQGGALPIEVRLECPGVSEAELGKLAVAALESSLAELFMTTSFSGAFTLTCNGARLKTRRARGSSQAVPRYAPESFGDSRPAAAERSAQLVEKCVAAEPSDDSTHGAGASLREAQSRTLHLRNNLALTEDGQLRMQVALRRPLGSSFSFLAESGSAAGATARAPDGLEYMASGLALCFMTQMGRYAKITRRDLQAYGVIQDLAFDLEGPAIASLDTHVYVETSEDEETARRYVDMSEQTCFLHAACRSSNPTRLSVHGLDGN